MGQLIEIHERFLGAIPPTGATAGPTYLAVNGGHTLVLTSALGLGVTKVAGAPGIAGTFDAVAEVAHAGIYLPPILNPAKPFYVRGKFRLTNIGDANALDFDFGLANVIDATVLANMGDASLTKYALFHMDGNSANILCRASDSSATLSPTDTNIDNDTGVSKVFEIIRGATSQFYMYIDGARVLSGSTMPFSATGALGVILNMEKTSDDTEAAWLLEELDITGESV